MTVAGDSGTDTIDIGTDTLTIAGGTGITSAVKLIQQRPTLITQRLLLNLWWFYKCSNYYN